MGLGGLVAAGHRCHAPGRSLLRRQRALPHRRHVHEGVRHLGRDRRGRAAQVEEEREDQRHRVLISCGRARRVLPACVPRQADARVLRVPRPEGRLRPVVLGLRPGQKAVTAINDLVAFADGHKVNYKILKVFNPWMRQTFLPNKSRKKYEILFPKSGYYDFRSTELEPDTLINSDENLQLDEGDE